MNENACENVQNIHDPHTEKFEDPCSSPMVPKPGVTIQMRVRWLFLKIKGISIPCKLHRQAAGIKAPHNFHLQRLLDHVLDQSGSEKVSHVYVANAHVA